MTQTPTVEPRIGPGKTPRAAARAVMICLGNVFFGYRDALFPLFFVLMALGLRPVFVSGSPSIDRVLDGLGLAVAMSGQALRAAVIGLAYIKRGGKDKRVHADTLVQEGFFAHSRNPLYVGNVLVLMGLIVIHGSPYFLLAGGAFYITAYLAITMAEEQFLEKKFGAEYRAYCQRVPRFLPRWHGLRETVRGMTFDWRRVIRKEYGSTFSWTACALALLVWEDWRNLGPTAAQHKALIAAPVFAVLLVAYLGARGMKKTRRLGHD